MAIELLLLSNFRTDHIMVSITAILQRLKLCHNFRCMSLSSKKQMFDSSHIYLPDKDAILLKGEIFLLFSTQTRIDHLEFHTRFMLKRWPLVQIFHALVNDFQAIPRHAGRAGNKWPS